MKKPVNEIFYSLQGEGFFSGRPAVFIRFSGCNLHCSFCDTDHSAHEFMTDKEILSAIAAYKCSYVVLTGGEPALYVDDALIDLLHQAGKFVSIETNGTKRIPESIDWVTLSPKCDFCDNASVLLTHAHELKLIYQGQDLEKYLQIPAQYYYLQPCDDGDEEQNRKNLAACISYCMEHPKWSLSLQLHKLLSIR